MADKQSRESIVETKVSDGVNESSIRVTSEGITITGTKITVGISETLTGLKAIQREAKKATQELREMENASIEPVKVSEGEVRFEYVKNGIKISHSYGGIHALPKNLERTKAIERLQRFEGIGGYYDGDKLIFEFSN